MFPKRLINIQRLFILKNEIRLLSNEKSKNDKKLINDKKKSKESTSIKVKDDKGIRLKSLEKDIDSFKSIGPNDKETINKTIAKPKIYIRQSARSKEKMKIIDDNNVEPMEVLSRGLDKRLVEAARRIADRMPKHSARQTEKQLLSSIQKQKKETDEAAKKLMIVKEDRTKSISFQILSNKNESKNIELGTSSKVVRMKIPEKEFDQIKPKQKRRISLFSNECLSIFDPKGIYLTDHAYNSMWEKLSQRELEIFLERPLKNHFEEMIKWTEEGKLWKYPIDNEQGLEHEASVPFYDHVLLDNLLDEFPKTGPIRQFMELVLLGLSQNPYITVERKRETIKFYKNFFEERNLLLEFNDDNINYQE